MKKALLILLLLMVFQLPSSCANKKMIPATGSSSTQEALPNIFIYSIPDDNTTTSSEDTDATEETYVNDTQTSSNEISEDEVILNMKQETDETETSDNSDNNIALGATVLKGYAQYVEDSNSIYLKDGNNNFVLNLKNPQKISASKGLNLSDKNSSKASYATQMTNIILHQIQSKRQTKLGILLLAQFMAMKLTTLQCLKQKQVFLQNMKKADLP